jgi:hypothetical protein
MYLQLLVVRNEVLLFVGRSVSVQECWCNIKLTLSLLMYVYIEILVKPEILTSYIHGPTFGNAESSLFLFSAQCFNIESMQKVILWHSCV